MERFNLNIVNKTLTITSGFAKAIQKTDSEEFRLYIRLMAEIPGLKVARKSHKSPTHYLTQRGETFNCNQFKNLTYKNMEGFIDALPQKDEYMKEYAFVRDAASKVQTNRYTLVRKWFMAQFPLFRKNPMFYLNNKTEIVKASDVITEEAANKAA